MKPVAHLQEHLRDTRFRLLTEPASLKRHDGGEEVRIAMRFPAPHRAGLIEARVRVSGATTRALRFRLLTEPASLKRCGSGWRPSPGGRFRLLTEPASLKHLVDARIPRRRLQGFPAPHRAGLIEAASCARTPSRGSSSFRLLTEPASLKPSPIAPLPLRAPRFRLLTEPASLKPAYRAWRQGQPHGFRLLTEPASLKLRAGRGRAAARVRVSGSSQSRPH